MADNPDHAARVRHHAETIMKAAGSSLRHYETRSKADILSSVMDCFEEAYRAGADFAFGEMRQKMESKGETNHGN